MEMFNGKIRLALVLGTFMFSNCYASDRSEETFWDQVDFETTTWSQRLKEAELYRQKMIDQKTMQLEQATKQGWYNTTNYLQDVAKKGLSKVSSIQDTIKNTEDLWSEMKGMFPPKVRENLEIQYAQEHSKWFESLVIAKGRIR
jgi:hypothetical protein